MLFKKAVLIIHGFAGGTYDEEELANYLELNHKFDVFTFTLPGHGASSKIKAKYTDWIQSAEDQMNFLINNNYNHIYVIGHSMGGVIATYLASKYSQVKKLVLAAPAFKYFYNKNDKLSDVIKKGNLLVKDYGYETIANRIVKASLSSVNEFIKLVKKYQDTPSLINIPTLIVQGLDDRVVPIESSRYVFDTVKGKKYILYVKDCTHDVFKSSKVSEINCIIEQFLLGKYNIETKTI